jgi:hypothetical protein
VFSSKLLLAGPHLKSSCERNFFRRLFLCESCNLILNTLVLELCLGNHPIKLTFGLLLSLNDLFGFGDPLGKLDLDLGAIDFEQVGPPVMTSITSISLMGKVISKYRSPHGEWLGVPFARSTTSSHESTAAMETTTATTTIILHMPIPIVVVAEVFGYHHAWAAITLSTASAFPNNSLAIHVELLAIVGIHFAVNVV